MVDINEKEFRQLADYIKLNYGIHLKDEKRTLLTGRLNAILEKNNFTSFSQYYNHVISDNTGNAVTHLINRITTNYTYFMREAEHFDYFRDAVLPYFEKNVKDRDLRVWSAGCSTGEEPYTLAFILDEYFKNKKWWDTKIFATDISDRVLEHSKKGIYENKQLSALPAYWRLNYFSKIDNEYQMVADRIKKEVLFRKFNLISGNFDFKKSFHVIFCRNVMIYFDNKTKVELINKFYDLTAPGGYLFIGHSESIDSKDSKYKYVMPAVYRRPLSDKQ